MSIDLRNVRHKVRRSSVRNGIIIPLDGESDNSARVHTTTSLAQLLGVKRNTVVKWILGGKIPAKKTKGMWAITEGVAMGVAQWWTRKNKL